MVNEHSIRNACTCCEVGAFLIRAAEEFAVLVHDAALQVIESRRTASILKNYQVPLTRERDGIQSTSYGKKRDSVRSQPVHCTAAYRDWRYQML
jgi:hypothetical protein